VRSKSSRTEFFKIEDTQLFLIQNKLNWHYIQALRGRTFSEKLPKITLSRPSLIHQLRLLGSQQHPQSGVLLTSFATSGTENSLTEINLESTGVNKGLQHFWGSKIGEHCSFVGERIIVQQEKITRTEIPFPNTKNYSLRDVQRFCYHSLCESKVIYLLNHHQQQQRDRQHHQQQQQHHHHLHLPLLLLLLLSRRF
jgi:hypothetical protein